MIKKLFNYLMRLIKIFFKGLIYVFNSTKFIFIFPLISIAASAFSLFILLIIENLINLILPNSWQVGFIETGIAASIFIILIYLLFNDKLVHDENFNYNKYLYSFIPTFLIWAIPLFWLNNASAIEVTEIGEVNFFYLILYTPHFWLSTLTSEFFYSTIICMFINSMIFFFIAKLVIKHFLSPNDEDKERLNDKKEISNNN